MKCFITFRCSDQDTGHAVLLYEETTDVLMAEFSQDGFKVWNDDLVELAGGQAWVRNALVKAWRGDHHGLGG